MLKHKGKEENNKTWKKNNHDPCRHYRVARARSTTAMSTMPLHTAFKAGSEDAQLSLTQSPLKFATGEVGDYFHEHQQMSQQQRGEDQQRHQRSSFSLLADETLLTATSGEHPSHAAEERDGRVEVEGDDDDDDLGLDDWHEEFEKYVKEQQQYAKQLQEQQQQRKLQEQQEQAGKTAASASTSAQLSFTENSFDSSAADETSRPFSETKLEDGTSGVPITPLPSSSTIKMNQHGKMNRNVSVTLSLLVLLSYQRIGTHTFNGIILQAGPIGVAFKCV